MNVRNMQVGMLGRLMAVPMGVGASNGRSLPLSIHTAGSLELLKEAFPQ